MSRERIEMQSGATEAAGRGERGSQEHEPGSARRWAPERVRRAVRQAAWAAGSAAALGLAASAGCSDTAGTLGQGGGAAAAQQDGPIGEVQNALLSGNTCVYGQACQSVQATTTIQRGGGVGNVFDSGINNNGVSSNAGSGTSGTIPVGDSGSPATARQELMNFDLTSITNLGGSGYNIVGAQVSLYFCPNSTGQTINVHQSTQSWGATTAQFSTYETTVSWPSYGESFIASPLVASFGAGAANAFPGCVGAGHSPSNARFDVTALVSGWVNGTTPQDGILFEQTPVAGVSTTVLSSEYPPALSGYHPTLFVEFNVDCATGTADCDDNGLNGCETNITTTQNCGACGNVCVTPNATPACVSGACAIGSCNMGYGDCDGIEANGCETMLTTNANCGACGVVCALPNATASCATGTCTLTACAPGFFDCDGNPNDGCEPLPCADGQHCATAADCSSGVCNGGFCASPTCSDGVQNENETDVDCGGVCPPCVNGKDCNVAADCQSGVCTGGVCQVPTCSDGVQNGNETDVDCGGVTCPACPLGDTCLVDYDCASGVCVAGFCQAPSCNDGVQNGNETGVDCGGGSCPACADGISCAVASDCASGVCSTPGASGSRGGSTVGVCQVPNCGDGVQNGNETGPDCGGSCPPCVTCSHDADCPAGDTCENGYCHAAPCAGYGLGTILCGLGACQVEVPACVGGQPNTCTPGTPGAEVCGDGLDNNCNGEIDEGCACVNGATQPCYTGSAQTLNVGACHGGTQTCMHGQWGACAGEQTPTQETCDGIDNDCNGQVDEGLGSTTCGDAGCSVTVQNCVGGVVQTCDPTTVNGQSCNDNNACTQTDTCQGGTCVGNNPVLCTALDQCHVAGVCDPSTGACSNPAAANGTACNDGNACTRTDTCQSGACVGSNPVVCTALDQCHTVGTCNTGTGVCSNPLASNGTACNDGNPCTSNDVCNGSGTCAGTTVANGTSCGTGQVCVGTTCTSECFVGGTFYAPGAANPANQCQSCQPGVSTTAFSNDASGTACNDGNPCTTNDACNGAGTCTGASVAAGTSCGAGEICNGSGSCFAGCDIGGTLYANGQLGASSGAGACEVCNSAVSTTSFQAVAVGTSCGSGDICTGSVGGCAADCYIGGTLYANGQLNPGNQCQACLSTTSTSAFSNEPSGFGCNDGNACTQTDTCNGAGTCVGSNPVVCHAEDACHSAGTCSGGVCSNPILSDGQSPTCGGAGVHTIGLGGSATVTGYIVTVGSTDYFDVNFTGPPATGDGYLPQITLSNSQGGAYTMEVYSAACAGGICSGTQWDQDFPQNPNSCLSFGNCANATAPITSVVVAVTRASGTSCADYTVTITQADNP